MGYDKPEIIPYEYGRETGQRKKAPVIRPGQFRGKVYDMLDLHIV